MECRCNHLRTTRTVAKCYAFRGAASETDSDDLRNPNIKGACLPLWPTPPLPRYKIAGAVRICRKVAREVLRVRSAGSGLFRRIISTLAITPDWQSSSQDNQAGTRRPFDALEICSQAWVVFGEAGGYSDSQGPTQKSQLVDPGRIRKANCDVQNADRGNARHGNQQSNLVGEPCNISLLDWLPNRCRSRNRDRGYQFRSATSSTAIGRCQDGTGASPGNASTVCCCRIPYFISGSKSYLAIPIFASPNLGTLQKVIKERGAAGGSDSHVSKNAAYNLHALREIWLKGYRRKTTRPQDRYEQILPRCITTAGCTGRRRHASHLVLHPRRASAESGSLAGAPSAVCARRGFFCSREAA